MADGVFRFQQPGAGQYYYPPHNQQNHHARHLVRNGSPPNGARNGYVNDTPSPSHSPIQQPSHHPYGMFNQGHQQGQQVMMNGGQGHQRYMPMNLSHKYPHQGHQQHHAPQNNHHHHQQNHGGGHGGHGGIGHQHTFSSSVMSTPHFTPADMHSGTPNSNQGGNGEQVSKHWQHQLQLVAESRQAISLPHHHCKKDGALKTATKGGPQPTTEEQPEEGEPEQRNRAGTDVEVRRQDWDALDMSGQGVRILPRALFLDYVFLGKLFLDHNKLTFLHPAIRHLRNLKHLDVSHNELSELPEEIGMLVNLNALLVFDNHLQTLPDEIGNLFRLETLGIEGNPLSDEIREDIMQSSTQALITRYRENMQPGPPPAVRKLLRYEMYDESPDPEIFSVLSYNILSNMYATSAQYGYTPSKALSWDHRKNLIVGQITGWNADIVCLQEVDTENYHEFFRRELAMQDYKGVYWPKSRARTMTEKEAKAVDGCAIFYKGSKYICLDKQLVDFANMAINRPDMKKHHDIFNRVMPRDDIGVIILLENRLTGTRIIVVNVHIFWNPAYRDVKLVQVAILMEQIAKLADKWAKLPPCTDKVAFRYAEQDGEGNQDTHEDLPVEPAPSQEYATGAEIPVVIGGDFNSSTGTGVYDLITQGSVPYNHSDLGDHQYGDFTKDGMSHPFSLKSAYSVAGEESELPYTNYTPNFAGVLDYIWYSTNALQVRALLGHVDEEYMRKVPGFPNHHFPSDHLPLFSEFSVKPQRKERKVVEADFGQQRERRN